MIYILEPIPVQSLKAHLYSIIANKDTALLIIQSFYIVTYVLVKSKPLSYHYDNLVIKSSKEFPASRYVAVLNLLIYLETKRNK